MTVTVSTSLDAGDGAPAAVPVDATLAVQAARAFAAQAQAYLMEAQEVLEQVQQAQLNVQTVYDQAQGLYNQTLQKVASQLGVDGLTKVVASLNNNQPAGPGVLYLDGTNGGGAVVLSS